MKRACLFLGLLAIGCNTTTSALIEILGPTSVGNLTITVQRTDKTVTYPLATSGKVLSLPASVIVLLPDAAESIDVTLAGSDDMGRSVDAHDRFTSQPHHQVRITMTLGAGGDDQGLPGDGLLTDLAIPDGADLSAVDLKGVQFSDGGGNDMSSSLPSLQILSGLPGDNDTTLDGTGTDARLIVPQQAVLIGTSLYTFEFWSSKLRKVDVTNGAVTTVPLIDDADLSSYYHPGTAGLVYDASSSTFYISNNIEHTISTMKLSDMHVKIILGEAGVPGANDSPNPHFNGPVGMAFDSHGNLFVTDNGNCTIRQIVMSNLSVVTVAGDHCRMPTQSDDGTGSSAHFASPNAMAFDTDGTMYITDQYELRKALVSPSPSPAVVSTVIDSNSHWADDPLGIVSGGAGLMWVVDSQRNKMHKITLGGTVTQTIVAGHDQYFGISLDGTGTDAYFTDPHWLVLDGAGSAYITESGAVRKVDLTSFAVTTLAGLSPHAGDDDTPSVAGAFPPALFNNPTGLAFDGSDTIYVADHTNNMIRTVSLSTGETHTLAGKGNQDSIDGNGLLASFGGPTALARDTSGNLYVSDSVTDTVRRLAPNGDVLTIAGIDNVPGPLAPSPSPSPGPGVHLNQPSGLAFDGAHTLFVADSENHALRAIDLSTAQFRVTNLVGTGSPGEDDGGPGVATFNNPSGLAWDAAQQLLYVSDYDSSLIRTVDLSNRASPQVHTLVGVAFPTNFKDGSFATATFFGPLGLALDDSNQVLWVSDNRNMCIRRLDLIAKMTSTPVGTVGVPLTKAAPLPGFLNQPHSILPTPRGLLITSYEENTLLLATGL